METLPDTTAAWQGQWELYDLERDRGETTDVSASHPDVVTRLEEPGSNTPKK